jgi:hypothetical protein
MGSRDIDCFMDRKAKDIDFFFLNASILTITFPMQLTLRALSLHKSDMHHDRGYFVVWHKLGARTDVR